MFYFHPNKGQGLFFNLPKGIYQSKNAISRTNNFREYPYFQLPSREHFFDHRNFKAVIENNPCKASIFPRKKKIVIDKALAKVGYKPALVFVIGHEYYHCMFETEEFCDMGSANYMLRTGYNPSQITLAYKMLFNRNMGRKEFLKKLFDRNDYKL